MEDFEMPDLELDMTTSLMDPLPYHNDLIAGDNSSFYFYLDSIISGADIASFDV
jgi:hypothetical protein